ncbi:hypothetical protein [Comamonas composti]|uniref:hypothetical protein n=1 Tax=Comamonas composti TaxID=408558 RepID=UPI000554DC94|nr:hypothetical protein [Comamonas composti]
MDKSCNVVAPRPSAPDLMLDLLVARGGALPARSLLRAGQLLGLGENTVRVSLSRLLAQGKIDRVGRGSYQALARDSALFQTVDAWRLRESRRLAWQGCWLSVHDAAVMRSDKTQWRRHQLALGLRGFASLQQGLLVRPDNLQGSLEQQRTELLALGLSPKALVFQAADFDEATEQCARSLWNTRSLLSAHRHWLAMLKASHERLSGVPQVIPLASAVRESLLLGRQVIAHLLRDPLLPEELMPSEVRQQLHQSMQSYQRQALRLWLQWLREQEN